MVSTTGTGKATPACRSNALALATSRCAGCSDGTWKAEAGGRPAPPAYTDFGHAIRPQPDSPLGLAEFEQHIMHSGAPAVVLIDRALVCARLRYTRRLEGRPFVGRPGVSRRGRCCVGSRSAQNRLSNTRPGRPVTGLLT
jgi:hypothetical protein